MLSVHVVPVPCHCTTRPGGMDFYSVELSWKWSDGGGSCLPQPHPPAWPHSPCRRQTHPARPVITGSQSNCFVSLLKNVYPHEIQALSHVVTDRLIHDTKLFQLYHTMNWLVLERIQMYLSFVRNWKENPCTRRNVQPEDSALHIPVQI